MGRVWLLWGCLLGFLSVALGAFATHALQQQLNSDQLAILATANEYMKFHALALLALGLWSHWEKWSATLWVGVSFLLGIILFSGSLYIYVLMENKTAAMVTPVGGSLFLIGWILFAVAVLRARSNLI